MEKVLSIILLIILIASLFMLTGCSKKEEENTTKTSVGEFNKNSDSKFSWPDLKEYGIPTLDKGVIADLKDKSNKDGYKLNYDITVNSIKKSDIEEYIKFFDSSWSASDSDSTYILVSSDRVSKYSVVIELDEDNNIANISISSL